MFHSAHGIMVRLVLIWEQSILYTKSLQDLHRKGISMLAGSKMFSLTCKCIFYGPELNAKGGPHGIEFCKSWNQRYKCTELKEQMSKMGSFA